ncbi:MAG: hypothetical protein P8Q49_05260 [Schleiferiaceae bacterium]|nr:hypothetical protein [Schleiferiaceae bacterium]
MTLVTAVLLALFLGALVAWYTYFYKWRSTPYWALAFLRFGWFSLLVFALLAPEREEQVAIEQPQLIALRIDTSSSLKASVNDALDALLAFENTAPVKWVISDFNAPQGGNDELPWVYIGDGHIETPKGPGPIGSVLLEANALQSPPLINNIVVPERVEAGSRFNFSIRISTEGTNVSSTFNGASSNGEEGTITAPDRPGTYVLFVQAERNGVKDVVEQPIEVVPYFNTIQIITPYPHPHVGMVTRLSKELGFSYHLLTWDEAKTQLKPLPTVAIGGGEAVFEQLDARLEKPILWLDSSNDPPQGVAVRLKTPERIGALGAPEYYTIRKRDKKLVNLLREGVNWNGRGINWYQNSLTYPETRAVFAGIIKGLLRDARPDELRVTGPIRVYQNQKAEWVVSIVNNLSQALPADVSMKITRGEETFDVPQPLSIAGNGYTLSTSIATAGEYTLEINAKALGQQYDWRNTLTVLPSSIELHRPYNKALWDRYSKEEVWRANDLSSLRSALAEWELEGQSMVRTKKTPQHTVWWYWGAFLLCAFVEWVLRRRKGLS